MKPVALFGGFILLGSLLLGNPNVQVDAGGVPITGTVGTAYTGRVTASKGKAPYQFSLASETLPSGLSLSSAGNITGAPTAVGIFGFTVRATDSDGDSASRSFIVTIIPGVGPAPPTITTSSPLPDGTVGVVYSQTLAASGGTPPYRWSGTPPSGLSLSGDGSISGTPATAGTFNFTVTVTDNGSRTASRSFSITINPPNPPPLTITAASPLPDGTVGVAYSQTLAASGGTPPYRWSGTAPNGLSLSAGGSISGTPTAAGSFNFTATVTDSASRTTGRSFTIAINPPTPPPLTVTTPSPLPDGTVGSPYSQTLAASGGTPPYRWSGMPPSGLSLSADGAIAGTPTAAGAFNFTATVTDSASRTAGRSFSIAINPPNAPPLTVTTPSPLPDGTVGSPYSQLLTASGGTPPYRWSGSLPNGLSISAEGLISGSPVAAGAFNFTATVTDNASRTATRSLGIAINPPAPPPLTVTTPSPLPDGAVGSAYSQSLAALGGTPPYRWSGSPPNGLSLSTGGVLSGTPATAGTFNFTATVTDNASRTANRNFSIAINPPALTITTASPLPVGSAGAPYSLALAASGGSPPYRWSGSPPAGLTLSAGGVISGTPSAPGAFTFIITLADNSSVTATRTFAITVNPPNLTITTGALAGGSVGASYSQQLSATGGVPPLTWQLITGQLPAGLALDGSSGIVSGTLGSAGTFNFAVQVRDTTGTAQAKQFAITVDQGPPQTGNLTISTAAALPGGTAGAAYNQVIGAAGGNPPYSWSLSASSLPPGLTLATATGILSGVPNAPGAYSFAAQVRDARGTVDSRQFSITIARGLSITSASPLPNPVFGNDYSFAVIADGGTPPYLWTLVTGSLPSGLAIDAASGLIGGNPSGLGPFSFTTQVSDAAGAIFSKPFSITVDTPAMPALTLGSVPDTASAAQQVIVDMNLAARYPIPITGQVRINFVPDPAIGSDDPAVQFSSGGRAVSFTIPANSTQPAATIALQTGSVAGTIELQVAVNGAAGLSQTVKIVRSAPIIRNLSAVRNTTGFELRLAGLSTSRELTRANVRFAGSGLDTTEVNIPLDGVSNTWYQSVNSAQFGSQFSLILPFTIQGDSNAIQSATLTVSNSEGVSSALSVDLTGR